jgi:hypothetical protein
MPPHRLRRQHRPHCRRHLNIQASLNIPTVLNLKIANGSTLILGNAVSNNETITFTDTTSGNLQLTDFNSGGVLQGFNGKIASMTVGTSATTPTEEIELTGVSFGSITSASINNNGTASTSPTPTAPAPSR